MSAPIDHKALAVARFRLRDRWQRAVLMTTRLSASEKCLAIVLLAFANADFVAWPSQPTLARILGRSAVAIQTSVRHLRARGVLVVEPGGERGRQRQSSRYHFNGRWLANKERQLGKARVLDLWPDVRLRKLTPKENSSLRTNHMAPTPQESLEGTPQESLEGTPQESFARPPKKALPELTEKKKLRTHTERENARKRANPPASEGASSNFFVSKRERSRSSLALLQEFEPNPQTVAWTSEHCAFLTEPCGREHVERFRQHHISKGTHFIDAEAVQARFCKWLLDEKKYSNNNQQRKRTPAQRMFDAALEAVNRAREVNER